MALRARIVAEAVPCDLSHQQREVPEVRPGRTIQDYRDEFGEQLRCVVDDPFGTSHRISLDEISDLGSEFCIKLVFEVLWAEGMDFSPAPPEAVVLKEYLVQEAMIS